MSVQHSQLCSKPQQDSPLLFLSEMIPGGSCEVDMDFILGIGAFNLDKILEMDDAFLEERMTALNLKH